MLETLSQTENLVAVTNTGVNNTPSSEVQHMTGGGGGSTLVTRSTVLRNNNVEQFSLTPKSSLQQDRTTVCKTIVREQKCVSRLNHVGILPYARKWAHTRLIPMKRKAQMNNKVEIASPKPETTISTSEISQVDEGSATQNCSSVPPSNCTLVKQLDEVPTTPPPPPTTTKIILPKDILCAVCKNCGNSSRSLQKCDRCKKRLPDNSRTVSYSHTKKKFITMKKPDALLDKSMFYSKMSEQVAAALKSSESIKSLSAGGLGCSSPIVKTVQYPRPRAANRGRKSITIHNLKPPVPETVTISDDDEPPATDSSDSPSKVADSTPLISIASSSTASSSSKPDSPEEENDRSNSPIFPAISTNLSLANRSRCNRMEDELGNVVSRVGSQNMEVDDADDSSLQDELQDAAAASDQVLFHTRILRFGTMDINSPREVIMNSEHIIFKFTKEDKQIELKVFPVEFQSCECSFVYRRPVVILHIVQSCGIRIRALLGITYDSKFSFDPTSSDASQRYIVMVLDPNSQPMLIRKPVAEMFQKYQQIRSQNKTCPELEIFREITIDEANLKLTETCPQLLLSFPSSPDSESPYPSSPLEGALSLYPEASPPPHMGFSGPVENLITYPPPPAKGGITITNEDFYCLNEGEFLNDVIIDFFLKYLVLEKLQEPDRQRTHVFSSFFYKRLTQRLNRHSFNSELDAFCAPMIKRHAQVKTWTRHVDIFDKDYIIVPINENAHWFLAIICFPGMEHPQPVRYLFLSNQDNSTVQKVSAHLEAVNNPDETNKVIFKLSDVRKETCTELYGFKQPCILIFDSLAGPSRTNVVKTLREYLQVEWDTRKKTPKRVFDKDFIKGGVPKVPQQNNYSDCGVYVLQYVESFFKSPIKDFTIPIRIQKWFTEELVNSKRQEIQELIWNLKKEVDERNASANKS